MVKNPKAFSKTGLYLVDPERSIPGLKAPAGKTADAREAMATYLIRCPAAMSVRGCIAIEDTLDVSELAE